MTRRTSIDAYRAIEQEGLLSRMRLAIYKTVYDNGPMTSGEAFYILHKNSPIKSLTQSRARFTELRDLGVLEEMTERKCKVTGRKAIEWDVTDQLPRQIEKKKELTAKKAAAITKSFIEYSKTRFDLSDYGDVENLRELWTYCNKRLKK